MATLEPVRFGEFLRDRNLITDEQWLCALADHWSSPKRRRIGQTIIDNGFLPLEVIEAQARAFHDELEVVEVDEVSLTMSERDQKPTMPMIPVPSVVALA